VNVTPLTPSPARRPLPTIRPTTSANRGGQAGRLAVAILGLLLTIMTPGRAQELELEATPFSTVIDFGLLQNAAAEPPASLPIWLESVSMLREEPGTLADLPAVAATAPAAITDADAPFSVASTQPLPPSHTTYRLRLRALPGFTGPDDRLLLRLYFDDTPGRSPVVTGWSETGTQYYASAPLGSGLALPNTATLRIPTGGVDYLDITVPGDGSTVRQAFLSALQTTAKEAALDFSTAAHRLEDPFGNTAAQAVEATQIPQNEDESSLGGPPPGDRLLFGRIHARLDDGEVRITPAGDQQPTSYDIEFTLDAAPLLAAVSFEILNADPATPLPAFINGKPIGPLAIRFPDLSDPAYTGHARPFESIGFHYGSWAPCQKIIPGRLLQPGQNRFTLELPSGSDPVAIRDLAIQLKHHWKKLDYTLAPD